MSGSRRNAGALASFVDGYGAWLAQQGYSSAAATHSLTTLGHLGRWLDGQGVKVDQLAEDHVAEFAASYRSVHGHLPASSARPILAFLRASGVARFSSPARLAPVEQVLSEYRRWLVESRGLAEATVRGREQLARQFLLVAFRQATRAACSTSRAPSSTAFSHRSAVGSATRRPLLTRDGCGRCCGFSPPAV